MSRDLHLALQPEADGLLSRDDFALLTGRLLDQQVPMERALAGPYVLADRLGSPQRLDPCTIADMSEDDLVGRIGETGHSSIPCLDGKKDSSLGGDRV